MRLAPLGASQPSPQPLQGRHCLMSHTCPLRPPASLPRLWDVLSIPATEIQPQDLPEAGPLLNPPCRSRGDTWKRGQARNPRPPSTHQMLWRAPLSTSAASGGHLSPRTSTRPVDSRGCTPDHEDRGPRLGLLSPQSDLVLNSKHMGGSCGFYEPRRRGGSLQDTEAQELPRGRSAGDCCRSLRKCKDEDKWLARGSVGSHTQVLAMFTGTQSVLTGAWGMIH